LELGYCLSNFTGNDPVSEVNSNPKVRSSGMVLCHTVYPSTRLNSRSDFTVVNEPVTILTSDTVEERDEPVWTCHKGGHACVFVSTSTECFIKPVQCIADTSETEVHFKKRNLITIKVNHKFSLFPIFVFIRMCATWKKRCILKCFQHSNQENTEIKAQ
jgi:hypothetical protein